MSEKRNKKCSYAFTFRLDYMFKIWIPSRGRWLRRLCLEAEEFILINGHRRYKYTPHIINIMLTI